MVPALLAPDLAGAAVTMSEPYLVVTSRDHPVLSIVDLRWADLLPYSWCLPLRETPLRRHFDTFMTQQLLSQPLQSVETNSMMTLAILLEAMPLIALAPGNVANEWAARGEIGITPLFMLRLTRQPTMRRASASITKAT